MSKYLIAILLSAWSISLRAQVAEKLQQLGMENMQSHRSSYGRNVRGKSANGGVGAQYPPAMHYAER